MSTKPSSRSVRKTCLERDNHTCVVCGLREPEIMHVDHKIPRHVMGVEYDSIENLVTLCPNDHARKTVSDRGIYPHPTWNKGLKLTDSQKSKIDKSGLEIGRKWAIGKTFSEEHKLNLSKAHKGNSSHWKGKSFTDEHRKKLSEAHKGKKPWNYRKGANEIVVNGGYV